MKKACFIIFAMLVAYKTLGMDVIDSLERHSSVGSITFTPTNVAIHFVGRGFIGTADYTGKKEPMILTPDKETTFYNRVVSFTFAPITLKNQQKGFRIVQTMSPHGFYPGRKDTVYIALGDTPVEVGEDDLEMIWKNGKLRTLEECKIIAQREKEESEAREKFNARFNKAVEERCETEDERQAFCEKLDAMESREAILAYLDELESQQDEPPDENALPPPCRAASRSWLWWLALPAVAGAGLVFHLGKRRK